MANKGWSDQESGHSFSSNARTTGRLSGTQGAEGFIRGSQIAATGEDNDPLDEPGDLFGAPGQLSESHGCSN
jgi:hypothetical protein